MIVVKNGCTFVLENNAAILTTVPNNIGSEFIIPPYVNKLPVTIIGDSVFKNNNQLINVGIPASVTDVKEAAFANCSKLQNVKFYETPKISRTCKLHKSAFANCVNLKSIHFVEKVLINGDSVFLNCKTLSDIKGKFNSLLSGTFSGCENLEDLTFYGKSFISTSAFYHCTALNHITFLGELSPKTPIAVISLLKDLKISCNYNSEFVNWVYEGVCIEIMDDGNDDWLDWF